MNYTEKILNHATKLNELHNIASDAVRKGVLSSFIVNDRDHSDMIGKGLYLGLNMTYHAIDLEINNIKSMMENGDKEMKELTVEMIKEFLDEKLSGFNTEDIRNQSTAKEIITIENTVMKKGITEVNKLHDLFHIKFNVDGVDCIVLRTTAGHLCGYIKTESEFEGDDYQGADEVFNAIGGITFVQNGYVGFDCAHYDQMSPLREYSTDGRYLPLTELIGMTIDLASQEKKLRDGEKKEPSATFDELIDVAVKASKENIVIINHLEFDNITITEVNDRGGEIEVCNSSTQGEITSAIDWINSLYTETFTIESEEDMLKIKVGARIELDNSNSFQVESVFSHSEFKDNIVIKTMDKIAAYDFMVLYGASVTQNKGGK